MNWWAIYTAANKEALADLNLRRKEFETWFPHTKSWEPSPKSKTLSCLAVKALLPRYLFVRCGPDWLSEVNSTIGVSTVVYAPGGVPFPIDAEILDALRKRLEPRADGHLRKSKFNGEVGQQFRFGESSPLFGFYATVVKVLDNEKLVAQLRSTLFGVVGREVEVPTADVGELLPIISNNMAG